MSTRNAEDAGIRTFLIADVRDYTSFTESRGDEAAATLVQRFLTLARDAIEGGGGAIFEVKGDQVLASFGSARSAIVAALDLQAHAENELVADLPLAIGVGLDAGETIAVAEGYRGGALNLASRLCAVAQRGEILASDAVIHLAGTIAGVDYTDRGPMHLKGFRKAVAVTQVRTVTEERVVAIPRPGEQPAGPPRGGFLGAIPVGPLFERERELEIVRRAIDEAGTGNGRLVLLRGEPGAGKTRLAQEVSLEVRNRGFLLASASCYEARQATALYPFGDVLTALYEQAPEQVRARALSHWPELARLLPGREPSPSVSTDDGDRLFRSVADFCRATAQIMPVAIMVDDVHWADSSSLELLTYLARNSRADRVFLLGTYRDVEVDSHHPLAPVLLTLHRQGLADWITVGPLDITGTSALVTSVLGGSPVARSVAEVVHRRTEGNPFFVGEVARALADRFAAGSTEPEQVAELIDVPEQVRLLIESRLQQLPETTQLILRDASVLGQTFTFDNLLVLTGRGEDELEQALQSAFDAGVIEPRERDAYAFNHALTQETLYGQLLPRRRRRLHRDMGEELARQRERDPGSPIRAAELAWHFLHAEDIERGVRFAVLAADEAEAAFAYSDAERQYRAALNLLWQRREPGTPGSVDEAHILERLGTALTVRGEHGPALDALEQAVELYSVHGDSDRAVRAVARIGMIHARQRTVQEGRDRLQPVLEQLKTEAPTVGHAMLQLAVAQLAAAARDWRASLQAAERAIDIAHQASDDRDAADAEVQRAIALDMLGQKRQARSALQGLVNRGDRLDLGIHVRALEAMGASSLGAGQVRESLTYRERALEIAQRIDDRVAASHARIALANTLYFFGEWKRAREQAGSVSMDPVWLEASRLQVLIRTATAEGQWAEASDLLRRAREIAGAERDDLTDRAVAILAAELEVAQGQPEAAQERLEALNLTGGEDAAHPDALLVLARTRLELKDLTGAEDLITRGTSTALAAHDRLGFLNGLVVQAMARSRQGVWDEAANLFRAARSLAVSMPYPYMEGIVLYEWGTMLSWSAQSQPARDMLTAACDQFNQLGAAPYAGKAADRLARLIPA